MKKLLFLLMFSTFVNPASGQIVEQTFPFAGGGLPESIATDSLGNVLVTGWFTNPAANNSLDIVRKYNPAGVVEWARSAGPNQPGVEGKFICTDASGNSYVLGIAQNSAAFQLNGGPVMTGYGMSDFFVAKYSPSGSLLWSKLIGGTNNDDVPVGIACDTAGNVIVAIDNTGGSTLINCGNNIVNPAPTGLLIKISASGVTLWAKQVVNLLNRIEVSPSGEIFIAGLFNNPIIAGSAGFPGLTGVIIAAKLDSAGNLLWAKTRLPGNNFNGGITAIATDQFGNLFIAGLYNGEPTFDGITLPFTAGFNGHVAKYSSSGSLDWIRVIEVQGGTIGTFHPFNIEPDASGGCLFSANFSNEFNYQNYTLTATSPGNSEMVLVKLDQNGDYLWSLQGGVTGNPNVYEQPTDLVSDSQGNCYLAGKLYNYAGGGNGPFALNFGGYVSSETVGFLYKVRAGNNFNKLGGRIFYDQNLNLVKEPTEPGASNIVALIQPYNLYVNASHNGLYTAFLDSANFNISLPSPPLYYTVSPASFSGSFTGFGSSDTTRHFAIQPIPGMQDLQITVTPTTVPRPGFDYPLHVIYKNIGTTTLTGSVELQLDSLLTFQNSIPAQTSITGNTLTWNFINFQPTQSATIIINTQVPATAILGTTIYQLASVSPLTGDLTPADNTDADSAIVVGSFDPNDKQVNYTSLTPTQVQNEEWLEYNIRFQNTGTDTAFTVRLADTLSTMLNIPTIEVLASSHPNTWSIKGTGIMEFRFDNILLPDSNTNEPASHGFVKYRIKPKTTLSLGDIVENTAYIYFDFNAPIVTNTATTEVKLLNSVANLERNPLHIYPNPNKGMFTLQCSNIWQPQVTAELRNVLGQTVWQQNLATENGKLQQIINTSGLSKGVYYLQVKTDKGSKVQKVVIE